MPFTIEAFYEQENNQGITDRIEIQQDGGAGRNIELTANGDGFKWRQSPITSESNEGLINPLANKIQTGKLTFSPRIDTAAKQTLLDDIVGSADTSFRLVWKIKPSGGSFSTFWTGNIDNKKRTFPETGGSYFAQIRANDFEILKTTDFPLEDNRQTFITTIADLLGFLNFGLKIRTATSWITEDTTDTTDFLSQIYHETFALRQYARASGESDQPISVWEALEKIAGPALLFKQVNGEFTVEQLTEFDDPENVNETVYTSAGVVDSATTTVDRTLDGHKSVDDGSLVIKNDSQNDIYPALKRARVVFDHRSKVSGITFDDWITLDSGTTSESQSQFFLSSGNQRIRLQADVEADIDQAEENGYIQFQIQAGSYHWNESTRTWQGTSFVNELELAVSGTGDTAGTFLWTRGLDIKTTLLPADADGPLVVTLFRGNSDAINAEETRWQNTVVTIINPIAEEDSTSILYQLTQDQDYSTILDFGDSSFGDGPLEYSRSALRFSSSDGDLTADSWQRRGSTAYRNFHENLLKEVLDLQRTNTRKLQANFWGSYDPTKILGYDSENFYCAGVEYTGVRGRWSATLFRVNVQTGSDTFRTLVRFSDVDAGGLSGSGSGGGGGGGLSPEQADDRYFRIANNLSEGNAASIRGNIGLGTGDSPTFAGGTFNGDVNILSADIEISGTAPDIATDDIVITTRNVTGSRAWHIVNSATEWALGFGSSITPTKIVTAKDDLLYTHSGIALAIGATSLSGTETLRNAGDTLLEGLTTINGATDSLSLAISNGGTEFARNSFVFSDWKVPSGGASTDRLRLRWDGDVASIRNIDNSSNFGLAVGTLTLSGTETLRVNGASRLEGAIEQTTGTIGTDNFASQTTGWRGTYAGDWDVRSLYTDELRAKAFTADITQALAGSDFLTKSVAILDTDFTIPWGQPIVGVDTASEVIEVSGDHTANVSVSDSLFVRQSTGNDGTYTVASVTFNGTSGNTEITVNEDVTNATADGYIGKQGTLSVEDLPGQNDTAAFTANDWIRLRVYDRTGGGLVIEDAWGLVTGYTDQADDTQDWTFTTLDSKTVAGIDVFKGSLALDYGQSGDGYIERTVLDAQGAPYSQIVTWTDNPIEGANKTVQTRTGNLNGAYGIATDEFGFAAGDYDSGNGNFVILTENTANLQIDTFNLDTTTLIVESTTPKIALGASADSLGLTSVSDTGTFLNGSGHVRVGTTDGSGNLTKGFTFDGTDFLLEAGNASIGASSGWFGANNILTYSASEVGLAGFTASSDQIVNDSLADSRKVVIGNSVGGAGFWGFGVTATGGFTSGDDFVRMVMEDASDGFWGIQSFNDGDLVFHLGSGNEIAGWNFDATDFWAGGDGTKANATVRLDAANGQILYDAMGGSIFARQSLASFGSGTSASAIDSSSWSEQASAPFPSTDTQRNTKIRLRYLHRFGINNIIVQGKTRQVEQSSSTAVHTSRIYATVKDDTGTEQASEFVQIGASSFTDFSISLDVSGLTEDTYYILEIDVFAFVEGADGSGINTHSTTTHLREDVFVTTAT